MTNNDNQLVVELMPPVTIFKPSSNPISEEESHKRIEAIRKAWAPFAPKEQKHEVPVRN